MVRGAALCGRVAAGSAVGAVPQKSQRKKRENKGLDSLIPFLLQTKVSFTEWTNPSSVSARPDDGNILTKIILTSN